MTEIEPVDMSVEVARINHLRAEIIEATDAEWAVSVASNTEKLRAWLKITKAAESARKAAVELECIALRQVALIWGDSAGRPEGMTPARWKTARGFASVDHDAFQRLLGKLRATSAPSALYNVIRDEFESEERERRKAEGFTSFVQEEANASDDDDERQIYGVRRAAEKLIEALALDGSVFTVAEAALDLGDMLEAGPMSAVADWHADDIQSTLRAVVRKAIQDAPDDMESGIPAIITYVDADLGPVRIPRMNANLSHLLAMSAYRRKQAMEAIAAADQIESAALAMVGRLVPGEAYDVSLSELSRRDDGEAIAA